MLVTDVPTRDGYKPLGYDHHTQLDLVTDARGIPNWQRLRGNQAWLQNRRSLGRVSSQTRLKIQNAPDAVPNSTRGLQKSGASR